MPKNQRQHWKRVRDNLLDHQTPEEVKKESPIKRQQSEEQRQTLIERKIQEAMADGAFDNLPGAGKPLNLDRDPYTEPGQDLAFGILKHNGMAPEWIERNKQIRREIERARLELYRIWQRKTTTIQWQIAVAEFRAKVSKINNKIDSYNLMVPSLSCQKNWYQADEEIERVKQGRIRED